MSHAKIKELFISVHLNLAQCYLKKPTVNLLECIDSCCFVLKEDPNNLKALFRRGKAYRLKKNNSKALADLMKAEKIALEQGDSNSHQAVRQEIQLLEKVFQAKASQEREKLQSVKHNLDCSSAPASEDELERSFAVIQAELLKDAAPGQGTESARTQEALRTLASLCTNDANRQLLLKWGIVDALFTKVMPYHKGEVNVILAVLLMFTVLATEKTKGLPAVVESSHFPVLLSTCFAFLSHKDDLDPECIEIVLRLVNVLEQDSRVKQMLEDNPDHQKLLEDAGEMLIPHLTK
eukprot:GCRY01002729.1.p1 GENE.GCRY01002729.1~~GCRY01002729.1.p1  ORF type:complete len:320 (+),score=29.91 GCRY01002729.1:84-962(+)